MIATLNDGCQKPLDCNAARPTQNIDSPIGREKKGLPSESFLDIRRVQLSKKQSPPLKDRPLRNLGQSLDEQIQDLVNDYMFWPMVFSTIMILFAVWGWLRYYRPQAVS